MSWLDVGTFEGGRGSCQRILEQWRIFTKVRRSCMHDDDACLNVNVTRAMPRRARPDRARPRVRFVRRLAVLALVALASGGSARRALPAVQPFEFRDTQGRFAFTYPASFGTTSIGTDNGFGGRFVSLRFSIFSNGGIGGEAVVGVGRPSLDVQAAGGLYDDIASGTLPPALRKLVETQLPALTLANFCDQIALEQHIDTQSAALATLPPVQRAALGDLDRLGNVAPQVRRCAVTGDIVTFDKEAAVVAGGPRRRTYGAVRFLRGARYSTFQLIRAGGTADAATLDEMNAVVTSFRVF